MNFENELISGVFIKRYKRFFVDVQVKNKVITAHCPNTGSMKGLLNEGNKVWLSKSNNPNRKLKYTLQIIEDDNSKVGVNTRFDFLIKKKNYKAFIEVKNVTLVRKDKIAEFPDAPTSRGAKHIDELIKARKKGYAIYIAFVVQREDCNKFAIANDIDANYSKLISTAVKKKLKILCYDCEFLTKGIKLNKQIKFKI